MENKINADAFMQYKGYVGSKVDKLAEEGKNVKYWERIKIGFDVVSKSSFMVSVGTVVSSLAMIVEANKHVVDPSKPLSENFGMLVATSLGSLAVAGLAMIGKSKSESIYNEKNDEFRLKRQKEQNFLSMLNSPKETDLENSDTKKNRNTLKM